MRLEPAFDLGFWAFGLILAFRDGMYSIHLGPLALCLVRNLPRVSMQELDRALALSGVVTPSEAFAEQRQDDVMSALSDYARGKFEVDWVVPGGKVVLGPDEHVGFDPALGESFDAYNREWLARMVAGYWGAEERAPLRRTMDRLSAPPSVCRYCGSPAHHEHEFRQREVCSGCGAFWEV